MSEKQALLPPSISKNLPAIVRNEVVKFSPEKQQEFLEEYQRKMKSKGVAYLLWLLFGLHYAYLGKWLIQLVFWITGGGFFVWWFIDLFRVSGLINERNKDEAVDVLRTIKIVSS
jgi:hypothetical protein